MSKYECIIRGSKRGGTFHGERRTVIVEAETRNSTREKPLSGAVWEAVKAGHEMGLEHIYVVSCVLKTRVVD